MGIAWTGGAVLLLLLSVGGGGLGAEPGGSPALSGTWYNLAPLEDYGYSLNLATDGSWTYMEDDYYDFVCSVSSGRWQADADSLRLDALPEATRAYRVEAGDSTLVIIQPAGDERRFRREPSPQDSVGCTEVPLLDQGW
ncbi:MAG: hypothetical protein WC326_00340 [Candidatus Delongbacteria bacterium]